MQSAITIPNYRKKYLKQLKARMAKKNPYWYYCISKVEGGYELEIIMNDRKDNTRDVDKFNGRQR